MYFFSGNMKKEFIAYLKVFHKSILIQHQTNFLGLIIDEKISWKPHSHFFAGKIA